jgi:hypothetical protein
MKIKDGLSESQDFLPAQEEAFGALGLFHFLEDIGKAFQDILLSILGVGID